KFYVDLAQKEGGKIALGGSAPHPPNERCREGYFFQPTVVTGLSVSCRTHRVAERINTGTVWVNCWLVRDLRVPFGGMKQSGVGREGGEEALRFFTEPKNVCIAK